MSTYHERSSWVRFTSRARAITAMTLIVGWLIVTVSGFLLYVAPEGRQSGQSDLFLGLTKSEWGDVHWWVSVAVVAVTLFHITIDWKALKGSVRYLTSSHRHPHDEHVQ